jgi:hypothetical protein
MDPIHPQDKEVKKTVEPTVLLRGLDNVGGLHGPSAERYR